LREGDVLVADERGGQARIESVESAYAQEQVFDLTVDGDHSFITEAGVAHNCAP
jgi:intein/homing endonuclease